MRFLSILHTILEGFAAINIQRSNETGVTEMIVYRTHTQNNGKTVLGSLDITC